MLQTSLFVVFLELDLECRGLAIFKSKRFMFVLGKALDSGGNSRTNSLLNVKIQLTTAFHLSKFLMCRQNLYTSLMNHSKVFF
jgi:hypothetical protein